MCPFGRARAPNINADLLQKIGACYHSTRDLSLKDAARDHGPFDIIFEATGYSPLVFEAMDILGKNGVLVLASVTGGGRIIDIPADRINLGFVLGNKVVVGTVNANREHFETAIRDFSQSELTWPGWISRLLTHRLEGLESFSEMMTLLTEGKNVIKVFIDLENH